jgi:hypothetical protein
MDKVAPIQMQDAAIGFSYLDHIYLPDKDIPRTGSYKLRTKREFSLLQHQRIGGQCRTRFAHPDKIPKNLGKTFVWR